jgi:hypothetical protein
LITNNLSTLKINKLSQEQYNREYAAGRVDDTALYFTPSTTSDSGSDSGLYGQHCWHKEGYAYNTYKWEYVDERITSSVTLLTATAGMSATVYYSTECD